MSKRWLLTKENRVSQVKEFSAFLRVGKCKSLNSLKSFFWYAPQVSRAVSWVFISWVSSGLIIGSGCSLMFARWQVFIPSWGPSGLTSSLMMTVISFVYWYGRKHFISEIYVEFFLILVLTVGTQDAIFLISARKLSWPSGG